MPLVQVDIATLNIDHVSFDKAGYHYISEADLANCADFASFQTIFSALTENYYKKESVFSVSVKNIQIDEETTIQAVDKAYGFNFCLDDGKPAIRFGDNVALVVSTGAPHYKLLAGECEIVLNPSDPTDYSKRPMGMLKLGRIAIPIKISFAHDKISYDNFESAENLQDLAKLLKSVGSGGSTAKLVDFVRPFTNLGIKGKLPKPLIMEVTSWIIGEEHPEYGTTITLQLNNAPKAISADGSPNDSPTAVWVNRGFTANSLLLSPTTKLPDGRIIPSFAEKALDCISKGGKVLLIVTETDLVKPSEWRPVHTLKLVPPAQAGLAATMPSVDKALESAPVRNEIITSREPRKERELVGATTSTIRAENMAKVKTLDTVAVAADDTDNDPIPF